MSQYKLLAVIYSAQRMNEVAKFLNEIDIPNYGEGWVAYGLEVPHENIEDTVNFIIATGLDDSKIEFCEEFADLVRIARENH